MTNNKSECEECKYVEICRPTFQACPEHEVKTTMTSSTSLEDTLKKQEEKNTNSLVTINSEKDVNKHESEDRDLRKVISKILVKWGMPTRQIAISEITELISKSYQRDREEVFKEVLNYLQKNHLDYCQEQNGLPYCKNCGLELEDIIKHFKIE